MFLVAAFNCLTSQSWQHCKPHSLPSLGRLYLLLVNTSFSHILESSASPSASIALFPTVDLIVDSWFLDNSLALTLWRWPYKGYLRAGRRAVSFHPATLFPRPSNQHQFYRKNRLATMVLPTQPSRPWQAERMTGARASNIDPIYQHRHPMVSPSSVPIIDFYRHTDLWARIYARCWMNIATFRCTISSWQE